MTKSFEDLMAETKQLLRDTKKKICRECKEEKTLFQSGFCKECYLGPVAERRQKDRDSKKIVDAKGYVRIYVGDKLKLEHRVVMEEVLGRPLTKREVVLHLDENKQNNDPSNLVLGMKGGTPFSWLKCTDCQGRNITVEQPDD